MKGIEEFLISQSASLFKCITSFLNYQKIDVGYLKKKTKKLKWDRQKCRSMRERKREREREKEG